MMCCLASGDPLDAREAYNKMPDSGKKTSMTQYLVYKVALMTKDSELGKCLV